MLVVVVGWVVFFPHFIKFPGLTSCDSFIVCFSIFPVIEVELIAYSSWLFFS